MMIHKVFLYIFYADLHKFVILFSYFMVDVLSLKNYILKFKSMILLRREIDLKSVICNE